MLDLHLRDRMFALMVYYGVSFANCQLYLHLFCRLACHTRCGQDKGRGLSGYAVPSPGSPGGLR
jgi:hypothetical protein